MKCQSPECRHEAVVFRINDAAHAWMSKAESSKPLPLWMGRGGILCFCKNHTPRVFPSGTQPTTLKVIEELERLRTLAEVHQS